MRLADRNWLGLGKVFRLLIPAREGGSHRAGTDDQAET